MKNLPRIAFGVFDKTSLETLYTPKSYTSGCESIDTFFKRGGNRGNLAWVESVFRILKYDSNNSYIYEYGELLDNNKYIDDNFDYLIINLAAWIHGVHPLGNIVKNIYKTKFKKCKVIALGNGCEHKYYIKNNSDLSKKDFDQSVVDLVNWFSDTAEIFSVRGEETQKTLKQIFNIDATALGCPSVYSFPNSIDDIVITPFKDALCASADYLDRYEGLNPRMKDLYKKFKSVDYFCQACQRHKHGLTHIELPMDADVSRFNEIVVNEADGLVKNYPHTIPNVNKVYAQSNINTWRGVMSKYQYYVGTRLHCAVIAMQCGVFPFIYYHDTRPLEVAELIGMPHKRLEHEFKYDSVELSDVFNEKNLEHFKNMYKLRHSKFVDTLNNVGLVI
jgi:hypothetical protein